MVKVNQRLTLQLQPPGGTHVHDGPGIHSDQINHQSRLFKYRSDVVQKWLDLHLSSFHAYIVFYTKNYPDTLLDYLNHLNYQCHLLYHARHVNQIQLVVSNSTIFPLPPCTNTLMLDKKLWDERRRYLQNTNLHCVYHVTSETGYVNLSITKLTYSGYDLSGPLWVSGLCYEGGVAINRVLEDRMMNLCNNYTFTFKMDNRSEAFMMSIISDTEDGFMLVVYSFNTTVIYQWRPQ